MKIAIGITHVPRKIETLSDSLASMPNDVDVTIYPDGLHRINTDRNVKALGQKVGCFKHYHRVLTDLCNSDADVIGIMPDDVQYHSMIFKVAAPKATENGVGYVACFLPVGMVKRYGWNQQSWHECKGGWATSWGGGYLFRREVAKELIHHPFIIDHLNNYKKNQQIDHAIPEAIHQMGLQQWYHYPSLLRHTGMSSTIGHRHSADENAAGW